MLLGHVSQQHSQSEGGDRSARWKQLFGIGVASRLPIDPLRNPFAPGAGSRPPELAGREELLAQAHLALQRIRLGRSEKNQLLLSLRDVDTTVLLNRIAEQAEALGYEPVQLEASEGRPLASYLAPALKPSCCGWIAWSRPVSGRAKRRRLYVDLPVLSR